MQGDGSDSHFKYNVRENLFSPCAEDCDCQRRYRKYIEQCIQNPTQMKAVYWREWLETEIIETTDIRPNRLLNMEIKELEKLLLNITKRIYNDK